MRRIGLAGVAAGAVALMAPAGAGAHAVLESNQPARGASLERAPERVSFRFNEAVEASFGAVRVYDRTAERVDDGELFRPEERSDSVGVGLEPGLGDGIYTATYRVISADSHPVSGGFTFTVGDPAGRADLGVAELVDAADAGPGAEAGLGAARFVAYIATAALVGGLVFIVWVWAPALGAAGRSGRRWQAASAAFGARLRTVFICALAVGAAATAIGIPLQGMIGTGGGLGDGLRPSVIEQVLETRFGTVWGLRLLDLGLLALLLLVPALGPRYRVLRPVELGATGAASVDPLPRNPLVVVALGLAAGFLALAPGLAGHPGVTDPRFLSLGLSFAHVLAFSVWAGGLLLLVTAVPAATRSLAGAEKTSLLAAVLGRFSDLALAAVAVLLGSGIAQAVIQLDAWDDLLDTGYGRALLVKAGLLVALIGLGALNRRRSVPRIEELARSGVRPPGRAGVALRRTMRSELILIGGVLAAAAVLTALSPSAASTSGPFSESTTIGPAQLELTVDPAVVGSNEIHLYLFESESGAQYDEARELRVTASLPGAGIGPLEQDVRATGPGHYVIRDAQLGVEGDWELDLDLRISAFEQASAALEVPIR